MSALEELPGGTGPPPNSRFIPSCGYRSTWDWDPKDKDFIEHLDWFEENLKIVDENDEVVPFVLNDQQKALEYYKFQCRREEVPCWELILKARKLGCSTLAEGTFFRDGVENSNTRVYIIAHDDESSGVIFEMTKNFHEYLPDKPTLGTSSSREISFVENRSSFKVRTAGAGGRAGRGGTFTKVHFSELDKWPDPEGLYGAVVNSIPDNSGVVVIAESTADGPMLLMNELWDLAIEGRNEFMPFFFPWWQATKYRREITWKGIRSYSPRDWLAKNRKFLDECEQAHLELLAGGLSDELGERERGSGGRISGSNGLQRDHEEGPGVADQAGRGEIGGPGGQEQPKIDPPSRDDEEAGGGAGGRVRGGDEVREDRVHGGPEGGSGLRELPETGGDGDGPAGESEGGLHDGGLYFDPEGRNRPTGEFAAEPGITPRLRKYDARSVFKMTLTEYEHDLIDREDLELEQIMWLRYCREHKCKGDETRRKREFPSYPGEAFEATGSDILDPQIIAKWTKEAKENPPLSRGAMRADVNQLTQEVERVWFDSEDKTGKIEIYEYPKEDCRYILAIDPSGGNADGDWQIGFMLNVETGDQAAEFRAKQDPDLCVDQLEYMALWFKAKTQRSALVSIEMNGGFGAPFLRHFADRMTCDLYEREQLDRITRNLTKRHGWLTSSQTRPQLIAELKYATRMEKWKVKSIETLRECRTLWENPAGRKVEARPGFHDDGPLAGGQSLMVRNWMLGLETIEKEQERKSKSPVAALNREMKQIMRKEREGGLKNIKASLPITRTGITGRRRNADGRRSRI